MKTQWQPVFRGVLACGMAFALSVFSGCEGDEDAAGVDEYFTQNPYESETRETPLPTTLTILPASASVTRNGQDILFTGVGGVEPYLWNVSNDENGTMIVRNTKTALYHAIRVGNNDIIMKDQEGMLAVAHVTPLLDQAQLVVEPPSASMEASDTSIGFTAVGGSPPYTWTVATPSLGTVSYSASSSYACSYTRVAGAEGQNIVIVRDSEGNTQSAIVTQ